MKLSILIFVLGLATTTAFAQRITKADDGLDKKVLAVDVTGPALLTLEMVQELKLTTEQQQEVMQLNRQRYEQLQESELTDLRTRQLAVQKVHLNNDKALMKILTPEQVQRFLELEGRQNMLHLSELGNE
ncbi:hypothetical protein [Pontibacter burrus]|uniref:Periplasmic heavy metal sensor n=1 Tax=Pontibacter burrus TaxID=2704466 RepID=A0A6B3LWQ1_9BACT|nr:hypothetical protein [Pontibacter burrus]NEM97881.1 hypothetical protein [Pontibacter burrus]